MTAFGFNKYNCFRPDRILRHLLAGHTRNLLLVFSIRADVTRDAGPEIKNRQSARTLDLIQQNRRTQRFLDFGLPGKLGCPAVRCCTCLSLKKQALAPRYAIADLTRLQLDYAAQKRRGALIFDVSCDFGFRGLSDFNLGFKSRFKMTPSEYIQTVA